MVFQINCEIDCINYDEERRKKKKEINKEILEAYRSFDYATIVIIKKISTRLIQYH